MAKILKTDNTKCCRGWRTIETFIYWWWKYKMIQPFWKKLRYFFFTNIHLSCDLATELLTKRNENPMSTKYFYNSICCSFIYNSQKLETTEISINTQSIKLWCHYKIEYYLTIKKNELLTYTTTWMRIKKNMLSEISQPPNTTYWMIPLRGNSRASESNLWW